MARDNGEINLINASPHYVARNNYTMRINRPIREQTIITIELNFKWALFVSCLRHFVTN